MGLNPPPAAFFTGCHTAAFSSLPGNRYLAAALTVGHTLIGHADFLVDTGNAGISILSATVAAGLAAATGGSWEAGKEGALILPTSNRPPTALTVAVGDIRVVLPPTVWALSNGMTIFKRYDKNVFGLPFIMAGDLLFDDEAHRVSFCA